MNAHIVGEVYMCDVCLRFPLHPLILPNGFAVSGMIGGEIVALDLKLVYILYIGIYYSYRGFIQ